MASHEGRGAGGRGAPGHGTPGREARQRIVTHTDFDGVISAFLIQQVLGIEHVVFVEPWQLQKKEFRVQPGDVIVDLPYGEGCALWFDHHASETRSEPPKAKGRFDPTAKSCARVIFEHYLVSHPGLEKHRALVEATDKIDSAGFTKEDLESPDVYGKLSIAIRGDDKRKDDEFRLFLLNMLSFQEPVRVIEQPIIKRRVEVKLQEHERWRKEIGKYVSTRGKVILLDRTMAPEDLPRGQPFFLYLMYPGHAVYLSVDNLRYEPDKVKVSCGENIFERLNTVDIGALMQRYGGGGHKAAGGCSILKTEKEKVVGELVEALSA